MARSDKEKKEIYDKWKGLINMSQKALDDWAENPYRLQASFNREKAKEEGGIQSGLDSLHRIKRRKSKPFKEWSDADFDNAAQENGFNGRMIGGKIGQPVGSTGMSKWEISLKNWGHDPALSSSPANAKYKAWKKSNKDAIAKSKAKAKKKASVERVAYRYLKMAEREPRKGEIWVSRNQVDSVGSYNPYKRVRVVGFKQGIFSKEVQIISLHDELHSKRPFGVPMSTFLAQWYKE